jgi:hypothetical protein
MDDLIKRKATGTPAEFAEKLEISRSTLMENIRELKILGGSIDYDKNRESYTYLEECCLEIKFKKNMLLDSNSEQIKGAGINFFRLKSYSPILLDARFII